MFRALMAAAWSVLVLASGPAWAQPVLVTAPKTILPTDTTITPTAGGPAVPLSTAEITVQNAVLTILGRHTIASLDLTGSAVLTHTAGFTHDYSGGGTDIVRGFYLTTTGNVTVAPTALIDVNARGYASDTGPGAGQFSTASGQFAGGGGHGGNGQHVGSLGGPANGSYSQPIDFGSGGGTYLGVAGGIGGGCARLVVGGSLINHGVIRANGGVGGGSTSGRGAGGSIWIAAGDITGAGTIEANGGQGSNGGAGGGGRISLSYTTSSFAGPMHAYGNAAGTGTVYVAPAAGTPVLTFDNGGTTNRSELTSLSLTGNLVVRGGVGLTHPAASDAGLTLTVNGNVTVEPTGVIDASGYGHPANTGPGAGQPSNASGQFAGGGGHGGNGQNVGSPGGGTYGSFSQPEDLGSGGGTYLGVVGGAGGGKVRCIVTGTLTVEGVVRSNGTVGGASTNGRGAGGSIWITAGTLAGSGAIEALGGVPSNGGGGGGGRVALHYTSSTFTGAARAYSQGAGAGTGTVYHAQAGVGNTLILDNGGTSNRTDLSQAINVNGDLIIRGGVGLGHPAADTSGVFVGVTGNATIEPTGSIDASERGHPGAAGPGAGQSSSVSGQYPGGGGYGGNGETRVGLGGPTNGSFTSPTSLGSGGGNYFTNAGGAGGGAIRLVVGGTLTVNGIVRANGGSGVSTIGRGSGGSIWITANALAGSGIIESIGGPSSNGGAGGGGRIAVQYASSTFAGAMRAYGASGSGTGTVYHTHVGVGNTLIFDNGGTANRTDYSQPIVVNGDLIVRGGVGLGHPIGHSGGLLVDVSGNMTVDALGTVDLTGRGHAGGAGPGAGQNSAFSGQYSGGGGHGGHGQSVGTSGGSAYGSFTSPIDLGSGGGNYFTNAGSAGGGALRLIVDGTLTLNGVIRSNGAPGAVSTVGRGSGGSLWITAGGVTGTGVIEADGAPPSNGGAGGGGRIAIYSCNYLLSPAQAHASRGGTQAGEGSVHLATASAEVSPPVACLGTTVTFTVVTVGNPGTLQWRHNGGPISDGPTPSGAIYSGTSTGTLTITNASGAEGGDYDCLVSGSCGAATTNAVSLLVTCCPDVNCDFALDGFDVECQERAVGGDMSDYCQPDPDFNRDFALDGFDVEAVELSVGGGPCP